MQRCACVQKGRLVYDLAWGDDATMRMLRLVDPDDEKEHQARLNQAKKIKMDKLAEARAKKQGQKADDNDTDNDSDSDEPSTTKQKLRAQQEAEEKAKDEQFIAPEGKCSQTERDPLLDADGSDGECEYSEPDEQPYEIGPAVAHLVKNADKEPLDGTFCSTKHKAKTK